MKKINEWILKNRFGGIGLLLGAIGGYLYWHFIGCSSGSCPITASPYMSVLWGALIGMGFLGLLDNTKKSNNENNNKSR